VSGSGSAGPYASLYLAPDRKPCQYPTTQVFYRPDALPAAQPTASKHRNKNTKHDMRMKDWFRVLAMFSEREVEERRDEKRQRALRVVDLTTSATKPTVICLPSSEQTQRHTHIHLTALSGTTQVSWYQKGKTNLDFTEARDSEW